MTVEAEVSAEVVTWRPRQPLLPGPHRVTVTGRDRGGASIRPATWGFTVESVGETAAAQLQPTATGTGFARFHGSVTLEGSSLSVSGAGADAQRNKEQLPRIWVNAGGLLGGGWRYSARVHVSGGFTDAKTDFHRLMANGRYLFAPRWTATLDGTWTSARSPDTADPAFGLQYTRTELMGGAEWEWTAASFITLLAGVVNYSDERDPERDTREIMVRLRLHRAF